MKIVKRLFTALIILIAVAALVSVATAEVNAKVDINKASVEELMQIKGIGQTYAERIVEYRENNGQYKQIEDIMKVKGIGSKLYESIKDLITVELPKK